MDQSPINNKKTALLNLLCGKNAILLLLFTGVACLRLFYCTELPVNTGDILRHIYYGLFTAKMGPAAVGHALVELDPKLGGVAWSGLAYNYPVVALLFFTAIAKLSPTIFFVKFVLTFIEAVNTMVIFRYTNQIWLALLYWASPISIWWVSHEGQFEPLQNLFVLVALLVLKKQSRLAFVLLALAVQVKLTAIFFVPYFVLVAWRERPQDLPAALVAFALGFTPTLLAGFYYPAIAQVLSTVWSTICNPYYWNVGRHEMFAWNPAWLVIFDQCATYGMLLLLVILAARRKEVVNYFTPVCFIVFCKISSLCQFWYFGVFLPFVLPVSDRRERLLLFALTPLLSICSVVEMVSGPFGFSVGDYYKGLDPFVRLTI
jgi:hypothetical protein